MRRIIYQSIAAPDVDKAEVFRLIFQARMANEVRGLSGFLVHIDNRFYQVLEGRTWKLFAAFETIRQDQRHRNLDVIDERTVPEAAFSSWRMRYFDGRNIPRMMAQIDEVTGGHVPHLVRDTLVDFLGPELFRPVVETRQAVASGATLLTTPAARPSFPRPC